MIESTKILKRAECTEIQHLYWDEKGEGKIHFFIRFKIKRLDEREKNDEQLKESYKSNSNPFFSPCSR
jgi:hypothetical protein